VFHDVVGTRSLTSTALRATLVVLLVLAVAACGGDDEAAEPASPAATTAPPAATAPPPAEEDTAAEEEQEEEPSAADAAVRPAGEDGLRVPAARARLVVEDSAFGRVLFDANGQVVYAFEQDRANESNCVGADCVKAWPPVLTEGAPTAGDGVDAALLGTIERDDGSLQVTYAGRPLYFYEHEAPGEIKCHNVDLHGGLWWVVGPGGDPVT
jgi:predicted lipoprotein with Yx(FWY)xxD motif